MKTIILASLLLSAAAAIDNAAAQTHQTNTFAIEMPDGTNQPIRIVSESDIYEYNWIEQTLKVRKEVLSRIPKLTTSGRIFSVIADGASIYTGRFVPADSSMTYPEPTISIGLQKSDGPAVVLAISPSCAQEPKFRTGIDPRPDERIRQSLAALVKLNEFDEVLSKKIAQVLNECESMVPGMTRAQLLKVFTTEGGLSTAGKCTYAHRRCPYIKVDVEFNLSETNQNAVPDRPADVVRRISPSYLQWRIID